MSDARKIVFYGNSLVINSLCAALGQRDGLEVVHLAAASPESEAQLRELHPDLLLFDVAEVPQAMVLNLFRLQPRILVVGIDLAAGTLLALTGQQSRLLTEADLLQAIKSATGMADML